MSSPGTWVPEACTLPAAGQSLRVAEFDELLASSVTRVELASPTHLVLDLEPSPATAARAAELMTKETGCCSFFTFTLTATGRRLQLAVEVAPAHADVLAALAGRTSAQ